MSSQRGNFKKKGQKHQNKKAWKNVYHDTSVQTQRIINTEVAGVCKRCKDIVDWRIKYKKYKPLTQPKTCVRCKLKTVKQAYYVYCTNCVKELDVCAKCGEHKEVVLEPSLSVAEQASQDRQFQFELESLPERKRRTFLRLQAQGKLVPGQKIGLEDDDDEDLDDLDDLDDDDDDEEGESDNESHNATLMKKIPSDHQACEVTKLGKTVSEELHVTRPQKSDQAEGS